MAQYKVPQDVEADDKLLGPFTFRQFVYLMIMGGCIGLAFGLFQLFPILAIIPLPFIIFFGALALPLKRDQPMETYLAAIVSYFLKPKKRLWMPGQRESTIQIIAPKIVEKPRARNISEEEAGNRLSFLANVIDTEGYAVRGALNNAPMHAQFLEEANNAPDILDENTSSTINQMLAAEQNTRHQALINQMRATINNSQNNAISYGSPALSPISSAQSLNPAIMPARTSFLSNETAPTTNAQNSVQALPSLPTVDPALKDLANNHDYSVATISKEAARITNSNKGV